MVEKRLIENRKQKMRKEIVKFSQYLKTKTSGDNSKRLVRKSFEKFSALVEAILFLSYHKA